MKRSGESPWHTVINKERKMISIDKLSRGMEGSIFIPEVNEKINKGTIGEMSAGQRWELGDGAGSTSSDGEAAGSGIRGRGRGLF